MSKQASHSPTKTPTTAILVIGNEILSGRTQDKNMYWLGGELHKRGIHMAEARVVPDVNDAIIHAVRELKRKYDTVFTSGGIGPTHDDITAAAIAEAVGQPLITHPEAEAILKNYYAPEERTPERMKMAQTPEKASLITNAISAAPGFIVENIYVLAGVPEIFRSMFLAIAHTLTGGPPIESETLLLHCPESKIAAALTALQANYPQVEMGSYPFVKQGKFGTRIVFTATLSEQRSTAIREMKTHLETHAIRFEIE